MTDVEADAEPMDAAVQEDESGRKIKGRGHKDASSLEVCRSHTIYNDTSSRDLTIGPSSRHAGEIRKREIHRASSKHSTRTHSIG